jgi:HAE1 family hydrophobic/amphiphilic exporter-1/multidrug efflux pump
VAIVLVLCAVFIPVAFLGGIAGQLYRQFAVTLTFAVVISGFMALTLTPALCALLMKKGDHHSRVFAPFNTGFAWLTRRFLDVVGLLLRHAGIALLAFIGVVAVCVGLFLKVPGSFVPSEDQGYIFAGIQLPDGATMERTRQMSEQLSKVAQSEPGVQTVMAINGFDLLGGGTKSNTATMFIPLKHWDERKRIPAAAIAGDLGRKGAGMREGMVIAFNPAAIRGLGTAGGFEFYLQNRGEGGAQRMAQVTGQFLQRANSSGNFAYAQTLWRAQTPQLYVDVDRDKAKALGVPLGELYGALAATLGNYYVNDFNKYGRTWQVLMSAEPAYRKSPDDIGDIFVRSERGMMVPVRALANVRYASGPDSLTRFNNLPAVKVLGQGRPGLSSGQAIDEVERIAKEVMPPEFSFDWGGASYQEKKSGGTSAIALGLAVIMVFLILAAQYERWSLPLSVLLALPFGTFGALAAVWLRGYTNDVYFQIGLVTLLGLAAKNAILIVQFAELKEREGLSAAGSALEAARLRFRPILMTSLAFIFGVLPLAISTGAGAGARRSVGTGVMGGMLAATFLAIFFVPMFFKLLATRRLRETRTTAELREEVEHSRTASHSHDISLPPHHAPRTSH